MEESLMKILDISTNRIIELSITAKRLNENIGPDSPDDALLLEAEVISSKLERGLDKLRNDLNNYFRFVNDPAVDDISRITTSQLEAEENLCELQVKIKRSQPSTSREGALMVTGKLPQLSLPEFDGDILHWHQFWDQFTSQVDNRKLSEVDKLLYLSSSLKGEAKKLIEGLPTTNKNYSIAVTTLKTRYGKVEHVKDAHYSALNKITPASSSVADCRKVLNDIERHLRVLSSLGEDTSHSYLRFLLLGKFPEELVYELRKKIKNDSILEIRAELENLISAKEDADRLTKGNQHKEEYTTGTLHVNDKFQRNNFKRRYNNSYQFNNKWKRMSETFVRPSSINQKRKFDTTKSAASEEIGSSGIPNKRMKETCVFCNRDHFSDTCMKFKTISERKAQLRGLCYKCFRKGHLVRQCQDDTRCISCKQTSHHRALCPKTTEKEKVTKQFHINDTGLTILQTAIVGIAREDESTEQLKCRTLLDSGSQRTYITQKLAEKLKLPTIEESRLTIFTFGSTVPQEVDSPRVNFKIVTRFGKTICMCANVVPMITHSVPHPGQNPDHWKDLADDGSLSDQIDLLIGNDYYFSLILTEKVKLEENLYMIKSELGWILSGKTEFKPAGELTAVTYFQTNLEVQLNHPDLPLNDTTLKELWDLEAIGISDSPKESREEEAIRHFNETTRFENNRYQVSWPWIDYPPDLKPNFGLAHGRLVNLMKRLDADTLTSYDQLIKEQERLGVIEVVPDNQISDSEHPIHYLPHHCVKQANKPIRIVYDASSKIKDNKSLNQCLYCGPMMLEDLTGLLLKFRYHNIGICADVEKAFLQIGLQAKDRDVTRFLWIKDTKQPVNEDNLLHMRFCRVPFGIISSPFLLNATIKHHLSQSRLKNIKNLAQDIYVDNAVTGVSSVTEAIDLYKESKRAFQQISMNLRDWHSNSKEFMHYISEAYEGKVVKILGLDWELESDTLHLRLKTIDNANTKRGVLKSIASVYDPCGYTIPLMVTAKLFLQDLWKLKVKWDTPLSKEVSEKWKEIQGELKRLKEICMPRCYIRNIQSKEHQLHCFTDASTKAYAAVVYVTQGDQRSFVIGKSRLVPIKNQEDLKIPRLELLGALIGSRLLQFVMKHLQGRISQQILWTDSQIVISWYHTNKLLTPFVSRRIEEMKRNKNLTVRHVPSNLNPADVATRPDMSDGRLDKWLIGPDFITEKSSKWPTNHISDISLLAGEGLERKSAPPEIMETETHADNRNPEETESSQNNKNTLEQDFGIIYTTVKEIKEVQSKYFPEELAGKETSLKRNLDLFTDEDGILRCKGRFKNADWTYDKRYPILIPQDCEYTDEIITKTHTDNYHVGAAHTLSIIRQHFWIPQGKRQVLKVIKKCAQCIKHGGGPFKLPPTPALPAERVNYTEPFTFTGTDYLGPILVKTKTGTEKRWICLFTCLAVRAVHLEVVRDLTAEEGLLAVRRFISTRNVPAVITSDNATNFKLLSEVLTQPYCIERKIKWRFIPQLAPWFGGYYERLMAIIKNCLRRTLQKHLLTDNQLNTVIKEIEAVINSRPLTHVDAEPTHILKPSDFLAMGRTIVVRTNSEGPTPQGTQVKLDLINSWRKGIIVLNEFKDMFTNYYLLSLRERYSHSHKQPRNTSNLEPSLEQIVQIKGDSKNREEWQVGKIISLIKGADDRCRVAKVKVGDKEYTRSIAQLYPLEIEDTNCETAPAPANTEEGSMTIEEPQDADTTEIANIEAFDITSTHDTQEQAPKSTSDIENIDEETTRFNDTDTNGTKRDDPSDDLAGQRPRREAAVKAMEKIGRWTRCLTSLL